jgi:hypothetical protein
MSFVIDRIIEVGKVAGSLSAVALVGKGIQVVWRWVRGNCSWAMPEIEQVDSWCTNKVPVGVLTK